MHASPPDGHSRHPSRNLLAALLLGVAACAAWLSCDVQSTVSETAPAPGNDTPPSDPVPGNDPPPDPGPGSDPGNDPPADPQPTDPQQVLTLQPRAILQGSGAQEADDPAIWIHPTDPARSLLFLSDKATGIYVFDLQGRAVQHVSFGTRINNIDVRSDVPWENGTLHCVAANLRKVGKLALLRIDPDWSIGAALTILCDASDTDNRISPDSYGFTLYRRPTDGALFVFDKTDGSSKVKQWRIQPGPSGVRTTLVRTVQDVAMKRAEGFVADDARGTVYFAEERAGIHQYRADPDDPVQTRTAFFAIDDGIEGDREGLALYACSEDKGYLVLSSQGNSTFKVYTRDTHAWVRTFRVEGAHGTDGLDVTAASVPGFPQGFLVIHDEPGIRYLVVDWADLQLDPHAACTP